MSSGGKSLVPLGGFTSIFCTSSVTGAGDNAPVRPPALTLLLRGEAAVDREERPLGFVVRGSLGMGNRRARFRGLWRITREEEIAESMLLLLWARSLRLSLFGKRRSR